MPQNFIPAGISALQWGQTVVAASGFPQAPQNFIPALMPAPQWGQAGVISRRSLNGGANVGEEGAELVDSTQSHAQPDPRVGDPTGGRVFCQLFRNVQRTAFPVKVLAQGQLFLVTAELFVVLLVGAMDSQKKLSNEIPNRSNSFCSVSWNEEDNSKRYWEISRKDSFC